VVLCWGQVQFMCLGHSCPVMVAPVRCLCWSWRAGCLSGGVSRPPYPQWIRPTFQGRLVVWSRFDVLC
jgi:hypothetical protein